MELLTGVFGVTTLIAAALAGLIWGTVKTLRESNIDLRARVSDLEQSRATDKAKIAQLESDNQALARVVTGEVHWHELGEKLDEHHREAVAYWAKFSSTMEHVSHGIDRIAQERRGS